MHLFEAWDMQTMRANIAIPREVRTNKMSSLGRGPSIHVSMLARASDCRKVSTGRNRAHVMSALHQVVVGVCMETS
jgi:hypothetical protein